MARIAGLLYISGAVLNFLALRLPHPEGSFEPGLLAVATAASVTGVAFIRWASRIPVWLIHASIAAGAALVALCVYFSGETASVYATMAVWVAVVAACFFPGRAGKLHLVWLLACYGAAIVALDDGGEFSGLTWWLLSAFGLTVVSLITAWLVDSARSAEEALRREVEERRRLQRSLEHLAHHDPLTGLANRRRFELELGREMARSRRKGTPLCVAVLDLDDFKALNDSIGHLGGDEVLREATARWSSELRPSDLLARYGGDEFVVLLPDCGIEDAEEVISRLCCALPESRTCSAGVALWDGVEPVGELLGRADLAMYEDKRRSGPSTRVIA